MRSRNRVRSSLRKGSIKKSAKEGSQRSKTRINDFHILYSKLSKNQVSSNSGRPHLSVRFCGLNKRPLMRELPLANAVRLPQVNRRQRGTSTDSPKLIVGSEVRVPTPQS